MVDAASRQSAWKVVGEEAGLTLDDGRTVTFVVDEITTRFQCTSAGALPPVNGMFVALHVTATTHEALAASDPPTFALVADGAGGIRDDERVAEAIGAAPSCAEGLLPVMGPGQQASGLVILDVPVDATSVALRTPELAEGSMWEWPLY